MSEIKDGGPAFPVSANGHVEESGGSGHENMWLKFRGGMSLRDYFAAAALMGMLARSDRAYEFFGSYILDSLG